MTYYFFFGGLVCWRLISDTAYQNNSSIPPTFAPSISITQLAFSETIARNENTIDVDDHSDEEYNVECILDMETRIVAGNTVRFYLIKWEGDWENTWEPQENVGYLAIRNQFKHANEFVVMQL